MRPAQAGRTAVYLPFLLPFVLEVLEYHRAEEYGDDPERDNDGNGLVFRKIAHA